MVYVQVSAVVASKLLVSVAINGSSVTKVGLICDCIVLSDVFRVLANPYDGVAKWRIWAAYSQSALTAGCFIDDVTEVLNEWPCCAICQINVSFCHFRDAVKVRVSVRIRVKVGKNRYGNPYCIYSLFYLLLYLMGGQYICCVLHVVHFCTICSCWLLTSTDFTRC